MAVAQRSCVVAYLLVLLLTSCKARIHKLTLWVSKTKTRALVGRELTCSIGLMEVDGVQHFNVRYLAVMADNRLSSLCRSLSCLKII